MSRRTIGALLAGTATLLASAKAEAHVGVSSGPAFADTSQEVTFAVGHGCAGVDTFSVRVEIPSVVSTVRAETSDFGRATVETDASGQVTAVIWQKPLADLLERDTNFYKLVLRIKVPNLPFTTLYFPTHQTCSTLDGTRTTVDWTATGTAAAHPGDAGTTETDEPAPALRILPARHPGWNKVTVPQPIGDLAVFFSDAQIVWRGSSAYSANPNTAALIATTPGVTALAALAGGDEIWVKY